MKLVRFAIFGTLAAVSIAETSNATSSCENLAVKAASQIYGLGENNAPITFTNAINNPKNTSNGASLIVTINSNKYLVLMPSPAGSRGCTGVEYVISYPYANWMPQ